MVDHKKRLTTNIVSLLSSLSAVLSMAVDIFIALLLPMPAGIVDSSGHIETQWICLQGKNESAL